MYFYIFFQDNQEVIVRCYYVQNIGRIEVKQKERQYELNFCLERVLESCRQVFIRKIFFCFYYRIRVCGGYRISRCILIVGFRKVISLISFGVFLDGGRFDGDEEVFISYWIKSRWLSLFFKGRGVFRQEIESQRVVLDVGFETGRGGRLFLLSEGEIFFFKVFRVVGRF